MKSRNAEVMKMATDLDRAMLCIYIDNMLRTKVCYKSLLSNRIVQLAYPAEYKQ